MACVVLPCMWGTVSLRDALSLFCSLFMLKAIDCHDVYIIIQHGVFIYSFLCYTYNLYILSIGYVLVVLIFHTHHYSQL